MASNPSQFPQAVVGGSPSFASLTVTGSVTAGPLAAPLMALQAQTPLAGFALQNATPTIISWTAPNDGKLHRAMVLSGMDVTVATTGGLINVVSTNQDASVSTNALYAPTRASTGGQVINDAIPMVVVGPGTTVSVVQASAVTAGAAVIWAEIWGS